MLMNRIISLAICSMISRLLSMNSWMYDDEADDEIHGEFLLWLQDLPSALDGIAERF